MRTVHAWKELVRTRLRDAMRERQTAAVKVLRELLSALDHAEAVDAAQAPAAQEGPIAGAVSGVGAGEVPRRVLDPAAVEVIVQREIAEREEAARTYDALGRGDEAAALRAGADVLRSLRQG